ncbi:MAG: polysaccharide deacetylase family protein [Carboxylicivirga sp.]|jgi:peptidoglycan/xylan/chitin deacetylase (PgdA/CDA1 family)|nr:polysaccharide deacetylase family protein [Carboxylicivirga sp.]
MEQGGLIISLDFELMWGVRENNTIENYGSSILGVWDVLPQMLQMFDKHNVKVTFATVGFLFAKNKAELNKFIPVNKPKYKDAKYSPYNEYSTIVNSSEMGDKYHFAEELINMIKKYPQHEIATHTFSHYYCNKGGQTLESFKEDIKAAIDIAKAKQVNIDSIVFPRNELAIDHLEIIKDYGISSYRGFMNMVSGDEKDTYGHRLLRLLDSYVNVYGHKCYGLDEIEKKQPYNIYASRFLRPYSRKLKALENLRLQRILKSMNYAAKSKKVYHLWWHPHNFGVNQKENLSFLQKVLKHYSILHDKYSFKSMTMKEVSDQLKLNTNN